MATFTKRSFNQVLQGTKVQTRRLSRREWQVGKTYAARAGRFSQATERIIVTRKFRQKLGSISQEDVRKEGFESLADFKAAWTLIYGRWDPEQIVTAYEFRTTTKKLVSKT